MNQVDTQAISKAGLIRLKPRKLLSWDIGDPLLKFLVVAGGIFIIILALQKDVLFNWEFSRMLMSSSPFFRYLLLFNSIFFITALVFRTFLWFRYRPYDSAKVEDWPEVTVIVPAYNEGETVYKTICSVADSDYPEGKLKIISVDDGSKDDTYEHMCRAKDLYPEMVDLIRFDRNKGKRQGLYQSFKKCKSPFVITVDSDTRLERSAVKELLTPLILNPKLGAVTGRIRIWNSDANILTKMMKANFAMAFDFTRAIQSTFSTVFCTSGAFSAYRRPLILEIMDKWLAQTFLKCACTYGEDRSLANHILRTGYGTAFQRTAVAFTMIPEKLSKILKMLTRWARSNIRESFVFSRIIFNGNRKGNHLLPFIEFFSTTIIVLLHLVMFYYFLFAGFINGTFIFRALTYTIIFGFFYMLYYIRIEGTRDFPYILMFSIFSSVFMVWIFTTAGFTLTKKGWATR